MILVSSLGAESWYLKNTTGLVVGVLKWRDAGLSAFSDRFRKDRELHTLLIERGAKADRLRLLLDEQATAKAIESGIRQAAAEAEPDSTFFFYYAGHGIKDETGSYIANYDIDSSKPVSSGISIQRIADLIGTHFRGRTVVFSGDFCYSGAFEQALRNLAAKGKRGFVLVSSTASNESTGNWTFSQTWIDCLSGNPLCDANGDGNITLAEANQEIASAMKFRERQRNGFAMAGMDASLLIAKTAGSRAAGTGDYVNAPYNGNTNPARIVGADGENLTVEFYFYSEKKRMQIGRKRVQPLTFRTFAPGTSLNVLWNGKAYPAKVLKQEDGFHLIRYDGYDASWDEWIMEDRVAKADTVLVEWQGKWYPARILKNESGRFFVHYDGFGDEWNEWVTQARIKKP